MQNLRGEALSLQCGFKGEATVMMLFKTRLIMYWSALVVFSILLTLAYFRGLENHYAYSGSVFQSIYPGSFANDAFMDVRRPILLSIFYWGVHVVGPVFLDDRSISLLQTVIV